MTPIDRTARYKNRTKTTGVSLKIQAAVFLITIF